MGIYLVNPLGSFMPSISFFSRRYMEITHLITNEKLIITPDFERLDAKNSIEFKTKVMNLINVTGKYQIVIDLHQINFMDSSGVGVFLALLRFLNSVKGELKICSITQAVRTILELVSLHKILDIYPTLEDALNSFKSTIKF
jgi:anti-anti-sigma factor